MKIALHWIQFESGGVDIQILSLLRNWPDDNDQFILLHNSDNKGYQRFVADFKDLCKQTIQSPSSLLGKGFLNSTFKVLFFPVYFLLLKIRAKKELKKCGKIDALMVHDGCYPGAWKSLAVLWAAHELGLSKRMLIVHHGALHSNIIRHPGESFIDYMIHTWATDIVAVSRATRQTLIDYRGFDPSKNPIRIIHNGVDRKLFSQRETVSLREKFHIGKKQILLGMLGRIERYKGHEDLLLALDEMDKDQRDMFSVLFIGEGDNREIKRLQDISGRLRVADNVCFTGYVPGDPVSIISQLDLLLMLTKDFEGFGLTIAEAMFAKTPVIATAVGAVQEFANNSAAFLVPPESPSDIAEALINFITDPEDFRQRAEVARAHIEKFSGKNMSRQYHRLLHLS